MVQALELPVYPVVTSAAGANRVYAIEPGRRFVRQSSDGVAVEAQGRSRRVDEEALVSDEQDLTRARNEYVTAVAEYDKAQYALLRASGGIADYGSAQ